MSGPERLDVGRRPGSRGVAAVVVVTVLAIVAGLVLLRTTASTPRLVPDLWPSPSPSPTPSPWPQGTGLSGTVYVLTDDRLLTLDAGSGLVTPTDVVVDPGETAMVPFAGGMLTWERAGSEPTRLLFDAQLEGEVSDALLDANSYLPGPAGQVWAAMVDPLDPAARTRWRLLDDEGEVSARADLTGRALPDGAGGLFAVNGSGLVRAYPAPARRLADGEVLATGPDGYVVRRCPGGRCVAELHDRASDRGSQLSLVPTAGLEPGLLSPRNRFVAYLVAGAETQVRVAPLGQHSQLRSFPSGSRQPAWTWLDDRWLLAASGEDVVLYDAVDDVLLHPTLPLRGVVQLVWQPS